jgi:hypothetical protein
MRRTVPTVVIAAAACAAFASAASADPINATGVRTYERTCDDGSTYSTYKVGHGASFIAGTDQKFVNLYGSAADAHDGIVTCSFIQVDGPPKGATDGTLTSKIVP